MSLFFGHLCIQHHRICQNEPLPGNCFWPLQLQCGQKAAFDKGNRLVHDLRVKSWGSEASPSATFSFEKLIKLAIVHEDKDYSHLSNKREVTLTDFEKIPPPRLLIS